MNISVIRGRGWFTNPSGLGRFVAEWQKQKNANRGTEIQQEVERMVGFADALLVPEFRKALSLRGLTKTIRMVNRDGANAIQDCGFSPVMSGLTAREIDHLADRFRVVGVQLQTLRIKTTVGDAVRPCDPDTIGRLMARFAPFIGKITRIVVRSATDLDALFPQLFMRSTSIDDSCGNRLAHINISAQPSTVGMWTILPSTIRTLRCSLQAGPPPGMERALNALETVSDHGSAPIGVDVVGGVLRIAPNLRKFVRKHGDGVSFFVTDADDLGTAVDTMEHVEQRIGAGLATDHQAGQNFQVYLAFDSCPEELSAFLCRLSARHPMEFASSVVVLLAIIGPQTVRERLAEAFPKADVSLVPAWA